MESYVKLYLEMCYLLNRKIRVVENISDRDLYEDAGYDLEGFANVSNKINSENTNRVTKFSKRLNLHLFRFYFTAKGKTDSTIKSVTNYYASDIEFVTSMTDLVGRFYQAINLVDKIGSIAKTAKDEEAENRIKLIKYSRIAIEVQSCLTDTTTTLSDKLHKLKRILSQVDSIEEMLSYLTDAVKETLSIDIDLSNRDLSHETVVAIKVFLKSLRKVETYENEKHFKEICELLGEIKARLKPTNPYNVFLYDDEFIKNAFLVSETLKVGFMADIEYINNTLSQFKIYLHELLSLAKRSNMLSGLGNLQSMLDRFMIGRFVNISNMMNMLSLDSLEIPTSRLRYYNHVLAHLTGEDMNVQTIFYNEQLESNPLYDLFVDLLSKLQSNLQKRGVDWSTEYVFETYYLLNDLISRG